MCDYFFCSQSVAANLRRSTRKRRISVNLEGFTDSSGAEDEDLMVSFTHFSYKSLDAMLRFCLIGAEFMRVCSRGPHINNRESGLTKELVMMS